MKYLVAIVPGPAIDLVTRAFGKHEIFRITVSEVEVLRASPEDDAAGSGGSGDDLAAGPRDFGAITEDDDDRRLRIEVAVNDEFVPLALAALGEIAAAGHSVWHQLLEVDDAVHIRTGERGPDAIWRASSATPPDPFPRCRLSVSIARLIRTGGTRTATPVSRVAARATSRVLAPQHCPRGEEAD